MIVLWIIIWIVAGWISCGILTDLIMIAMIKRRRKFWPNTEPFGFWENLLACLKEGPWMFIVSLILVYYNEKEIGDKLQRDKRQKSLTEKERT